eukprot:COSAG06_NODE_33961_length_481_cov_4.685864_1_plen_38_part_10
MRDHAAEIDFGDGGPRNGEGKSMFEVASSRSKNKSMVC